jgi:cell wall-associated NlpC family hydrolase
MAARAGVPGIAVALTAGGALLIYAGVRGVNPVTALREVAAGQTDPIGSVAVRLDDSVGGGISYAASSSGTGAAGTHPGIADASSRYRGDKYSQARRAQAGYSDCSSFAAKCMRAAGINVGNLTTTGFMAWGGLRRIDKSEIARGDLLINTVHMAIALDGSTAIGQQNPRRNVATGTFAEIMMNTGPWSAYRYTGSSSKAASV